MKECPVCNTQNNDEANVCMECGTRFENNLQNNTQVYNDFNRPENVDNTGIDEVQNTQQINNINQYRQPQNANQFNNPNQFQQPANYQQFNQNQFHQSNVPQNKKNKIVGLILNILLVGLGYAYVGKWGEGIVLAVVYVILLSLSVLIIPLIIAVLLWIYSLFKTNQMIDKYNQGLPY